jgi:hypothetical protein
MEPELDDWLVKANSQKSIVSASAKTLIAEHANSLILDKTHNKSLFVQLCAHKKLLLYVVVFSYLW